MPDKKIVIEFSLKENSVLAFPEKKCFSIKNDVKRGKKTRYPTRFSFLLKVKTNPTKQNEKCVCSRKIETAAKRKSQFIVLKNLY